jgi:hypothetical protein
VKSELTALALLTGASVFAQTHSSSIGYLSPGVLRRTASLPRPAHTRTAIVRRAGRADSGREDPD